jgi:hypothetical protein
MYIHIVKIHERVLESALNVCRGRRGFRFRPAEIVAALPDLNPASVRTHVMSRCCANAPGHHARRYRYFRRVGRGVYEIVPGLRDRETEARPGGPTPVVSFEIRETAAGYVGESSAVPRPVRGASLESVVSHIQDSVFRSGPPRAVEIRFFIRPGSEGSDPVIAAYEKDIDRSLIRENLHLGVEERLRNLQHWMESMATARGAARRPARRSRER